MDYSFDTKINKKFYISYYLTLIYIDIWSNKLWQWSCFHGKRDSKLVSKDFDISHV